MRMLAGVILLVAGIVLGSSAIEAQPPGKDTPKGGDGKGGFPGTGGFGGGFTRPQPGQVMPAAFQAMLKLTDEQKQKFEELQKEVDAKMDKILTDDQKKQIKEMRENRGGFGGGAPGGGFGKGAPGGGFGKGAPGGGFGKGGQKKEE